MTRQRHEFIERKTTAWCSVCGTTERHLSPRGLRESAGASIGNIPLTRKQKYRPLRGEGRTGFGTKYAGNLVLPSMHMMFSRSAYFACTGISIVIVLVFCIDVDIGIVLGTNRQ